MPAPIFPYPSSPAFQYSYDSTSDTWIPMSGGGGGASASQVQGNVAAGAADSGNPVETGYNVQPTPVATGAAGTRAAQQGDGFGGIYTVLKTPGNALAAAYSNYGSDGQTANAANTRLSVLNLALVKNPAGTLDRQCGDTTGTYCTAAPSAGTDRSITATTTSQQLMAANTSRHGFYIQNDSAVDVWVNAGATATAVAGGGNKKIAALGGYWESPSSVTPSGAFNVIAASATAAVTCREF